LNVQTVNNSKMENRTPEAEQAFRTNRFINEWPEVKIVLGILRDLVKNKIWRLAIKIVISAGDLIYESFFEDQDKLARS